MLKDTFFSFPRFRNLCRKEMAENWKSTVLRIALLYGIMTIIFLWNGYLNYRNSYHSNVNNVTSFILVALIWFLWIFGCLSASFTMTNMKSKTNRILTLMTPATPFEKFFSRWLIYTIGFLIVFLITFELADYTRVLVLSLYYPEFEIVPVKLSQLGITETGDWTLFRNELEAGLCIAGYFLFQSLFVLGSTIWPKNSALKTFVAIAVIFLTYGLTFYFSLKVCPLHQFESILPRRETAFTGVIWICIFFTLTNWILAYYRFKESEIIHRM